MMESQGRKKMFQALKKLVSNEPFDDVTVKDIVKCAGLNRQTFYYHFQDKYDCLQYCLDKIALENNQSIDYTKWQECYLRIFRYLDLNRNFIQNIVDSSAYSLFADFVLESIDLMLRSVIISFKGRDARACANFDGQPWKLFEYGLQGIVINWFRDGLRENPELLVNDLLNIDLNHLKMLLGIENLNEEVSVRHE
ncbi:TetR/AcrR family transcriptional regulator C-terminal domain-containing protein [Pediococcus acidilactici]|uniref:TetR/AcrR family transcriptional regulator C-terminal domain-containing protein n=2 Tax=Pediococcus acidilactici TaxID=1254 RepID=UPI000BEEE8A9|nr:TetR/AcrR family transcriptional regulator C-terminal domain-containing protein [Pediococcus acidilactici]MCQ0050948.1 TetR family transcriptional regulator [Pediococcus acidilactici]MCQ0052797.1 TetR family transcriptional regulator [Pediococcus acidilactici]MCQ0055153.1 TetR family transcriptional regulator [Pediococcus acidilactici]MCQ0060589.1 TetR family transcriptional regulator [Pediococcus acidilactici]MCQ0068402.1 TetR family transcriptional regulator [Pediococcus acidilactici]